MKIDYRLNVTFLNGQVAVKQPNPGQLEAALRKRYNTNIYQGDVLLLTSLDLSFSFMIEGPKLTPEHTAMLEDFLCKIWMENSSMCVVYFLTLNITYWYYTTVAFL